MDTMLLKPSKRELFYINIPIFTNSRIIKTLKINRMNKKSFFTSMILMLGLLSVKTMTSQAKFTLPDLPYAYDALEPTIDEETMRTHHSKHHQGYVNKLNAAIVGTKAENMTLEEILANMSMFSDGIRNNGGGHFNHSLFWKILSPNMKTKPSEELTAAINKTFTSMDALSTKLQESGAGLFGSGWVWLLVDANKNLVLTTSINQDNPLMNTSKVKGMPILAIDVWEHAYYLKYKNNRGEYLKNIVNIINWDEVSSIYKNAIDTMPVKMMKGKKKSGKMKSPKSQF
jgi:Fe-Mn family superoxide dismutase